MVGGELKEVRQVFHKSLWKMFIVALEYVTCLHLVL
jgi:hypothetical protein